MRVSSSSIFFFSNIIMEMKCVFILFGYLDYTINVLKKKNKFLINNGHERVLSELG